MNITSCETADNKTGAPSRAQTRKILYSRKESAELLSMSVRMVDYWIARKVLFPVRRIGGRVLIPVQVLHEFARRDHVMVQ